MKISIITATFNSEDSILEAINSVSAQSCDIHEHIIMDGASTDKTLDIIKNCNSDKIIIYSEPDKGIYDALNKAISKSTGDLIGFMHSDDCFYSSESLKKISDFILANDLDGVWSDLIYVKEDGSTLRTWKSCQFRRELLKKGWMPPHPTLYLKKSVYDKIGGFDLKYKIAADYDFIIRLFSSGKFKLGYLPELTIKMKHGGASNRSIGNLIKKSREDLQIIKNHQIGGLTSLLIKNFSKIGQFF